MNDFSLYLPINLPNHYTLCLPINLPNYYQLKYWIYPIFSNENNLPIKIFGLLILLTTNIEYIDHENLQFARYIFLYKILDRFHLNLFYEI